MKDYPNNQVQKSENQHKLTNVSNSSQQLATGKRKLTSEEPPKARQYVDCEDGWC